MGGWEGWRLRGREGWSIQAILRFNAKMLVVESHIVGPLQPPASPMDLLPDDDIGVDPNPARRKASFDVADVQVQQRHT